MAQTIAILDFPSVERTNMFPEIKFEPDIDLTGHSARVIFTYNDCYPYKALTPGHGLTVEPGFIRIDPFKVDWVPGPYTYELEIIYPLAEGETERVRETHFKGMFKVTD